MFQSTPTGSMKKRIPKTAADAILRRALGVALLGKRFERVIVVIGLRRSGHHAVINWIVNGLKASETHFTYESKHYIGWSTNGRVVHLNDVKLTPDPRFTLQALRAVRRLRKATFLVVSFEDVPVDSRSTSHHLASRATDRVLVRRSLLNLVASRLQARTQIADDWAADHQMPLDDEFFSVVIDHSSPHDDLRVVIQFDDFVSSDDYRASVAAALRLRSDLPGDLAIPGGGSSFTGRAAVPSASELRSRWQQVSWPDLLLERIWDRRHDLRLSDDEVRVLAHLRKTRGPSV